MECPECHAVMPVGATRCPKCNTPLGIGDEPTASISRGGWGLQPGTEREANTSESTQALNAGHFLGGRYEILQVLGQGGMGVVYRARDREVDREVALKVIRPDLAERSDLAQRFKQELILARQITHKNVIRIYDLGEAEGTKFISMEYIDGKDLRSIVAERGKLPPEEAAAIIEQVCRGLDAAHAEGVVHRDLKPQNVMLDKHGRVAVMDFGLAHSSETSGLTQLGALLGTPKYMSPEQAKGEEVDSRSDLFSLGIIFYELLTGKSPYEATTSFGTLLKRTQEHARPPIELDHSIPEFMNDIVVRCLEIDPQRRYASAQEILRDLEARHGSGIGVAAPHIPQIRTLQKFPMKWIAAGLILILFLIVGLVFRGKISSLGVKPKSVEPVTSLAIIPFRNASGDPSMDWLGSSLAEWLSTDVGQSSFLRMVPSERLHQILQDLRITTDFNLDPSTLGRLAEFSNAQTVVWGQYAKLGEQIRIDATLRDLKRDRTEVLKAEAPNEGALPGAVDRLAQAIREKLSLSESAVKELQAQAFIPSSKSLQALREYNEGLQLSRQGKNLEAQKRFQAATKEDPEFALAYSKLGQTFAKLGYDNEAEQASRKAVDLSTSLPLQEKNRVLAAYAQVKMDYPKAIESYEKLATVLPEDTEIQFNLAQLNEEAGSLDKARGYYTKVLERDPKSVDVLIAMGRVENKSGNPQGGLEYLNRALTLAIQLENEEGKATVLQAIGVAYRLLKKQDVALRNYQESLAIKRRLGDKRGMAASLNEIAQIQERLGKPDLALKSYEEALKLRREIGDRKGAGDILIDLGGFYYDRGQADEALKLFKESLPLQREVGNERNQALCLNNIGTIYFFEGRYEDAVTYFQQALQLREKINTPEEIAETLHNLAETNVSMGQFDQALSHYLRALELYRSTGDKRGAAIESSSIGTLFIYQGRYGAAVNSKEEALKTFRDLGDRDLWMADILSSHGDALIQAGRNEEAQKSLNEAMSLARELKNDALVAQIINYQGDIPFYRGDYQSAHNLYQQALQLASVAGDSAKVLDSRFDLARVDAEEGRSGVAVSALADLSREAETRGLKYMAVQCSICLAGVHVDLKDYVRAQRELTRALAISEKLGMRAMMARSHYLIATIFRLTGKGTEAAGHYRETVRLLEEIRKEPGATNVLNRPDLNSIYKNSTRWSQSNKG
jgi:serine/threonine protein kinase/tetratricopeptide (TPR) repeat protein